MGFRAARIKAGMRVTDVMSAMKVSDAAVYYWEAGRTVPNARRLGKLAELYGCSVEDLLTGNTISQEKSEKTDSRAV